MEEEEAMTPWEQPDLSDLLLHGRRGRAVLSALGLAFAVAAFRVGAGDAGPAGVAQLLLLVPGLVLEFVVQDRFEVHHCPGMPSLEREEAPLA